MANTYYDSQLTAEEIEEVLEAINGILTQANNGKVLAISNGKLEARSVQWGGGEPSIESLSVTENGTYTAPSGVDGYSPITVNVPGSGAVVQPLSVNQNGTYNPPSGVDGYAPVTVNVSGGSGDILSGTTPPASSLGNNGDVYKRYFPIPSNVTFVEYLESSGTQYINTGIYATQDIDAIVTGDRRTGSSNAGCMLGVRTGAFNSMSKTLYFGSHVDSSGGLSVMKTGAASNAGVVVNVTGISTRRTYTMVDENGYYIYYSVIDESPTYSRLYRQSGAWQSDMPLCMFGFYSGSTFNIGNSTRVIRVTILDKNVPIADYIPCLDGNGVACMWDSISEEYVYNDGTGDFLYGSIVTPDPLDDVYYLKENGAWHVIQQ